MSRNCGIFMIAAAGIVAGSGQDAAQGNIPPTGGRIVADGDAVKQKTGAMYARGPRFLVQIRRSWPLIHAA
jgi:hypothetical protein